MIKQSKMNLTYISQLIIVSLVFINVSKFCSITGAQNDFSDPGHLIAKRTVCGEDKFQCGSGRCIDKIHVCDGYQHCGDGGDETYELCQITKCAEGKFRCGTGACIDSKNICNGYRHCNVDGNDEALELCENRTCSKEKFRCSNGACIDRKHLCDGYKHCNIGGDDETYELCQNTTCSSNQFRCATGACISFLHVCDGYKHCNVDGSDETAEQCKNTSCPSDKFRCATGACIDKKFLCDHYRHCGVDGRDESNEVCQRVSGPVCHLPPVTTDKTFTVDCPDMSIECSKEPGEKVPNLTLLTFRCKHGFKHTGGNSFVSSCSKGKWLPAISKCSKTCRPIKTSNVDLTCFRHRNGALIPCNGSLPEGAFIYPKCKSQYHKETEVDYQYIQCQSNGHWDRDLFKCIPDCGKIYGNLTALVAGGKPERHGDSPWHVAIYDIAHSKEPELICGGTIISPTIIISAAHCFYDTAQQKLFEPSNYEITVSKVTRKYGVADNSETRTFKIGKIFVPSELVDFTGDSTGYAGDIAILWTTEKIIFSRGVLPACIDWTDTNRFVANENSPGKLVGWGETADKTPSEILLAVLLPYISYTNCRRMVSEEFANSIAIDKFCGGKVKGAGARPGDSGGGFVFRDPNTGLYYLRGIVSNKDGTVGAKETSIAAFTDVAQYVRWIYDVRIHIENEELLAETTISLKT